MTELVVLFVVALAIALLVKSFVVQPFTIPSSSMENTLLVGDKVLVNKMVYDFRSIGRGDIVVFSGAGSWDSAPGSARASHNSLLARGYDDTIGKLFSAIGGLFSSGSDSGVRYYIKRVIGLPGDRVQCCSASGQVTVNGVPLSEKTYLYPQNAPSTAPFSVVVPPGRLYVLGDHRLISDDSRLHSCGYPNGACLPWDRDGTIPESAVVGRAFMIIWPVSRIQILRVPATFGQPALRHAANGQAARLTPVSPAGLAALTGARLAPAAPYLPLAAGLAAAAPVTLLEFRIRRRLGERLARSRSRCRASFRSRPERPAQGSGGKA